MPSLRKKGPKGNYFLYFRDAYKRPKEKSVPMKTSDFRVADQRKRQLEKLVERGDFNPWSYGRLPWVKPDTSLAGTVETYLKAKASTCRPKTIRTYRSTLSALVVSVPEEFPLAALSTAQLKEHVLSGDVTVATKQHRYRNVRALLNWAKESNILDEDIDPLKGFRMPKSEKRLPAFLSADNLNHLVATIKGVTEQRRKEGHARAGENVWLTDVVIVAAYTGLRLGELVAARWSWVNLETWTLVVRHTEEFKTKSGHERPVPLTGPALETVQRLYDTWKSGGGRLDDPLFAGPRGNGIHAERTSKRFKHFIREAALDENLHFHSLRHSCGSMLAHARVPDVVIKEILGHASTQTTTIYIHAAAQHVRDAMEAAFGNKAT